MTVKAWIVLVFLVIVGGGILVVKVREEKGAAQRPDFFKNDLSNIRTDNGEKF